MTDKDLIKQLKGLKEIKPGKDWVLLTKRRIFEQESAEKTRPLHFPIFQWKLAFAPVISVFIVIGLFGFAENTVPGGFLFPVKKAAETAQVGLSSTAEKSEVHLRLANKRLEDLNKIAQANQVKNLSPAIEEFQNNLAEAVNGLSSSLGSLTFKELVIETQKLEKNKQKVESVLGVQIGGETQELEKQLAAYLLADLENRTLNEEDQKLLQEAKEAFEEGGYTLALGKLWFLSQK